ncbi:uncharacterized protein TrAFT101_009039 [Trichoderma asperellum]|nr:hypothetical protein TrAFT101_009039 [Trichoderma asperellum]
METWKPDKTSSASAAAVLAKDYKILPAWEPVMDGTGAKAAVLAVGSASTAYRQTSIKKPPEGSWGNSAAASAFTTSANRPVSPEPAILTTTHGSSAATQAFQANRIQSAKVASSPPPSPREKPLAAAKGAMSPSRLGSPRSRTRSYSTPPEPYYADAKRASVSALNGASIAHQAAMNKPPEIEDTGAIPITTMTRNMFTSHPPVKPEVDEQTTNERIHQSAVEMAKKMYQQQQLNRIEDSLDENAGDTANTTANRFVNLQDAAYRQAQERLAKLQDEHERNRRYQEYYSSEKPVRRRFTIMDRLRRRSASESDVEDRARSDLVHQQMSLFTSRLDQVDEEKRERDREALLIAARRNVKASLQGMDEQHYFETGKVNPTILGDWQIRAQQAAQLRHDTRAGDNNDRVDIGGGMFMDADEIDAIAARRVRPVLDDIHEKAEAERERLASIKLEEEARKAEAEREKDRERELKEIQKRAREEDKQQEKARRQQEKLEEKQRKEEEKAAKAEQKRLAKEEKKKPKPQLAVTEPQTQEGHSEAQESRPQNQENLDENQESRPEDHESFREDQESHHEDEEIRHADNEEREGEREQEAEAEAQSGREIITPERTITPTQETAAAATTAAPPPPPTTTTTVTADVTAPTTVATDNAEISQRKSSSEAPTSPTARVKGWIKNRFSRGKSMSEHGEKKKSFIGGAALRDSTAGGSTASLENRTSSIRDVTLAGRTGDETPVNHTAEIAPEIPPEIVPETAPEAAPEAMPETTPETAPETAPETVARDSRGVSPVSVGSRRSSGGKGSGRSNDMDRFETPAAIADPASRQSNSPARDSRFREMMDH